MFLLVFDVITIFPEFFTGPLSYGMVCQALKRKIIEINLHDLREFASDRHRTVDDRPFGGGEGMVLKPEPLFRAIRNLQATGDADGSRVILFTPQGTKFNQRQAQQYTSCKRLILVCGRYEGVDERVAETLVDEEISIGDYILSGGEVAACVFFDSITRLLPGVLNNSSSVVNESFSERELDCHREPYAILDHPTYTRPEEFEGHKVPDLLLSGDHKKVDLWRRKKALEKTLKNRPDLLKYEVLSERDKRILNMNFDSTFL
jgi:tRNA (guanine37-N1)-methyltransferase